MQLHSFVRSLESKLLIEAKRLWSLLVCGQLEHVTAKLPGAIDCPPKQLMTKPLTAVVLMYSYRLDLGSATTLL